MTAGSEAKASGVAAPRLDLAARVAGLGRWILGGGSVKQRTAAALVLATIAHTAIALGSGRWSSSEREYPLKSGDRLIEKTANRARGGSERTYFIRWRADGRKEQILHLFTPARADQIAVILADDYRFLVQGSSLQWRREDGRRNHWSYAYVIPGREVFGYLQSYLDRHFPGSYSRRGDLLFLPRVPPATGPDLVLRDDRYSEYPYQFADLDVRKHEIWWGRTVEDQRLPPKIVFSDDGQFGRWTFDPAKTDAANASR
jgi:hypothetical protein